MLSVKRRGGMLPYAWRSTLTEGVENELNWCRSSQGDGGDCSSGHGREDCRTEDIFHEVQA